ncbi:hypothetical protein PUNSTDRAFT_106633 [Punctularia strigosozonata HHB-11173 SS5]|uniref:uncharacterized protein n=1 Tax=Punctularia strigosozonata (strain HHB-11173) TaxID=741275 RepID=UPI000441813D|nr:uncharacterized protein PUNSTDRAFT_106633 [Punctularia strigosozonata HHB-11173 SS5]EIN05663.1 hypothetical protein PUNSTDRAFT_106633 [Punctularia strigosozonata HHB-11173 SS5]
MAPSTRSLWISAISTLTLASIAGAHSNGMDMSMDGAMSLESGQMLPYLHFTTGDILWFLGWVPKSTGAMVGACIGLFLLAIFERWLAACRALGEAHWRMRAQIALSDKFNSSDIATSKRPDLKEKNSSYTAPDLDYKRPASLRQSMAVRMSTPFIPSHDIPRGIIQAAQTGLGFAFMLVVMTYQVGFILSIVIGEGVGETLFGRYASSAVVHYA